MRLFGNDATIYGCVEDDYNSCETIQNVLGDKMPEALILGGISHSDMDYFRLGELKFMK
jgi:hypothetical protein